MTDNNNKRKFDPALIAFVMAAFILVFLTGGYLARNNHLPFSLFNKGLSDTKTLVEEASQPRPALLGELHYEGTGVTRHYPARAFQGLTLLQGSMPGGTQLRLIDMDGGEIRRWPIDFFALWPEPTHLIKQKIPWTHFNYHTQGVELLRDGSVIFNIGGKGTAKLDKCGNVQWTLDRMTHHSVTQTDDNGFWIPAHREIAEIPREYMFLDLTRGELIRGAGLRFNDYENLILRIDENGVVLREFSILKSLIDAGFESVLYDTTYLKKTDPTHVNDIEVVTGPLADKIPGVEPDDILVSIRNAHLLVILDETTGELKWSYRGHWIRQHDPDITPDGNIVVFNNGSEEFNFNRPKGSNLMMLDPLDNSATTFYPKKGQPMFFSDILGEQQSLPNGNYLITESRRGRVFEVDSAGRQVWNFLLPYDETHASLIAIARRFPLDFFTVDDWDCP